MSHALLEAVARGDVAAVRSLVATADGSVRDEFGRPPLAASASRAGQIPPEVIVALLDGGADVNQAQGEESEEEVGWTALHHACMRGTFPDALEVVQILLARGANAKGSEADGGVSPLYFALTTHHLGIAEALLKAGADANAVLANRMRPLHYAVELFLQRKRDNYEEGEVEAMASDAAALLLAHGANASARDEQGDTALAKALIHRLPAKFILALVGAGAPLDDRVDLGKPPQHVYVSPPAMAIGLGQPAEVLVAMLQRGFDTARRSEPDDQNLLHYAAMKRFDALDAILKLRPEQDVNVRDETGATALFLAAWKGMQPGVAALLDRGADPNVPDDGGNSPLHTAARNGHEAVIELLLARGADRTLKNQDGETAADRARKQGHAKLAERLG